MRRNLGSSSSEDGGSNSEISRQSRLHYISTQSSKLKKRALENVYDLFSDLESEEDEETGTGTHTRSDEPSKAGGGDEDNPTYEMATVRRFIIGKEPVSKFVENSRKMFLLKVTFLKARLNFLRNKKADIFLQGGWKSFVKYYVIVFYSIKSAFENIKFLIRKQ